MSEVPAGYRHVARLRPAQAGDFAAVIGLLTDAGLPTAGISADLQRFVVAEDVGRLIGAAGLERYGAVGLLRSVVVAPEARGTGVGAALVEKVLSDSAVDGVTDVYLLTTMAEGYFPRHGFELVSRDTVPASLQASVEFREACPATASVMHRCLALGRVLFLCTGNSARSQIAEAILNATGAGRFVAESAGAQPSEGVNVLAVEALARYGFQWTGHPPRGLDGLDRRAWDFVITVCDRALEACPVFTGQPILAHWGMSDPAAVQGTDDEKRRAFDNAVLLIKRRIDLFLSLPIQKLERFALVQRVRAIGAVRVDRQPMTE